MAEVWKQGQTDGGGIFNTTKDKRDDFVNTMGKALQDVKDDYGGNAHRLNYLVDHAIEINVMSNYEKDGVRGGYFICKRCGGTIRDIPKEETGQGKSMLELHIIGHDRDDKNKNARGDHKERYDDMKKWWEKPIAESKAEEDSLVKIEDDGKKITKLDEWEASEYICLLYTSPSPRD